ncbi:MAG: hypothetical protein U0L17_01110 [Acutalibacteraceae bacterium]|nr:hypothetical protein [Acutalibacteraceae bacterium]
MNFKKENQKSPDLSIQYVGRIKKIFDQKNWPIEESFDDDVFENFCKMLEGLEPEQRDLVLNLTENFLWVQEYTYIKHFSNAFDSFITSHNFSRGKKICICPLLPEEDFGKSKSSVFLLYSVKSRLSVIQRKYSDFFITYVDLPNAVNLEMIKEDYTLCLIDDFIGTGETVERSTKYFLDRDISKDMIAIISLVGMKTGLTELNKSDYSTYTDIICDKGISSNGDMRQVELMKSIEQNIHVSDINKFGYKGSEALVRMKRTPNNTFPIYWLRNKKNQFAPFPR